jgi:hypothetical protein
MVVLIYAGILEAAAGKKQLSFYHERWSLSVNLLIDFS